jgi:hypothetical protein
MADRAIKQNDTWPPLEAVLMDQDGPIDLTTAQSVTLKMRGQKRVGPVTVSGLCLIATPKTSGGVIHEWLPADTAVADLYSAEFEILWGDGSIQTVPNSGYFYIDVQDDLA